jgi:putative transcriptional regulator
MAEYKSPAAIAEDLGERLKQARLNANLTQADVAERSGVSRKVLINAEKGKVQLESLVAIMLSLNLSQHLDTFWPNRHLAPAIGQTARQTTAKSLWSCRQ